MNVVAGCTQCRHQDCSGAEEDTEEDTDLWHSRKQRMPNTVDALPRHTHAWSQELRSVP